MHLLGNIGTFFLMMLSCVHIVCWAEETPDSGERAYADSRRLLSVGDFDGAVKSLQLALRHDFLNTKYSGDLRALQNIVKIRKECAQEKDFLRWNVLARQLRAYYQKNRVRNELVDISLQIFDHTKLTWDAVCVINAMILAERFDDALDFAEAIDEQEANPSIQISKGYVLYAANRNVEARKLARSISLDNLQTPDDLLRLARLQAATELPASSVKTLTRCFELTPLGRLPELKEYIVKLPEFEPLLSSPEFAKAMTTQSGQTNIDRNCSIRWINVQFDQRPKYIRDLSKGPINPDDWKIK